MKYYNFLELIHKIEAPYNKVCFDIYNDNKIIFEKAKGSKNKHQDWEGGYISHITECMNIAVVLYESLNSLRKLEFKLNEALLVLFLHDIEKPWKYGQAEEKYKFFQSFDSSKDFQIYIINKYNIILNEQQVNALKYIHGENEDYDPNLRVQTPLAAFVHNCDIVSSRIWFNESKNNSW